MALDFVAGCFGGIAGVLVGHPLDTVKVHLQIQDPKCPRYNGTWHCFRTIVKKESVRGLFKGMTSPLAGIALINAITFGTYGNVLRRLPADLNPTVGVFVAGATAGLVQSVVASPVELAKSRLQVASSNGSSRADWTRGHSRGAGGPLRCLAAVHRADGWRRGVFRGLGVTALRDAPAFGLYFVSYELVCDFFTDHASAGVAGPLAVIMAGGISGTVSWIFTYPLDVVKTRVQTDVGATRRYAGARHCFVESYRTEGLSSFSRGISSTILRAFPTNAATFLAVSVTFRLLGHRLHQQDDQSVAAPEPSGGSGSGPGGPGSAVSVTAGVDTSIKWPPLVLQQSADQVESAAAVAGELGWQQWQAAHANYW